MSNQPEIKKNFFMNRTEKYELKYCCVALLYYLKQYGTNEFPTLKFRYV